MFNIRIGNGYDIHRLIPYKDLILGNVHIPFDMGFLAHSDGDVLIHAIIDSLLGAANLSDIGTLFPDTDPQYKSIDSRILLEKTISLVREKKFEIINIDSTIIAEQPKLKPYIPEIKKKLATILNIEEEQISLKAKTKEKLDAVGELKAIEVFSVCLLSKIKNG
ncbi:MAG: 2-C-methyl-D-erythritol 2,4-cyclodiphosphate synthase [Spirochaetes bacterium GWD1_27_9]|nr:MAG: 2-C-methyl-D-erythritol 2,4-cyclodiphosphate synthase [Spirochaetes bacterium GWC1_27_15]OHD31163.1 MAG: 2-C-methyl-D-erythritol 2,4-cyclodiphosphate synthase [Spirochaetes bacterium GWD1_27_9]